MSTNESLESLNRKYINQELIEHGSVRFEYEKLNGDVSIRTVVNPPTDELLKITGERDAVEDVIVLWSATDDAWRSFRLDKILRFL